MKSSSTASGRKAEEQVCKILIRKGFTILDNNWKNRYCEIDIVAKRKNVVWFVEVKYRKTLKFGSGLEYINPRKVKQMQFASEMWVHNNSWEGDYCLAAVEVYDEDFKVGDVITLDF